MGIIGLSLKGYPDKVSIDRKRGFMMSEWTLWIVYATNGKYGELTQVYAKDEEHARVRARNWIEAHPHLPEVKFKAYPNGFQMVRRWLPGAINVPDTELK